MDCLGQGLTMKPRLSAYPGSHAGAHAHEDSGQSSCLNLPEHWCHHIQPEEMVSGHSSDASSHMPGSELPHFRQIKPYYPQSLVLSMHHFTDGKAEPQRGQEACTSLQSTCDAVSAALSGSRHQLPRALLRENAANCSKMRHTCASPAIPQRGHPEEQECSKAFVLLNSSSRGHSTGTTCQCSCELGACHLYGLTG